MINFLCPVELGGGGGKIAMTSWRHEVMVPWFRRQGSAVVLVLVCKQAVAKTGLCLAKLEEVR